MIFIFNIEKITEDLKKTLSSFRYEHSLMVAEEARKLAKHYHYDEVRAYLAGLLHDNAKDFTEEENRWLIEKYNLDYNLIDSEFKDVAHAFIGASIAKEKYKLDDEICKAIYYHSIGNSAMSVLDKIVFVADKIGRKVETPIIKKEKELAYENLDSAILFILKIQQEKLEKLGKRMHPDSIELMHKLEYNLQVEK